MNPRNYREWSLRWNSSLNCIESLGPTPSVEDCVRVIEHAALAEAQWRCDNANTENANLRDRNNKLTTELNQAKAEIERLQGAWERAISLAGDWSYTADNYKTQVAELKEVLKDVIRNSHDIVAKKRCSEVLAKLTPDQKECE